MMHFLTTVVIVLVVVCACFMAWIVAQLWPSSKPLIGEALASRLFKVGFVTGLVALVVVFIYIVFIGVQMAHGQTTTPAANTACNPLCPPSFNKSGFIITVANGQQSLTPAEVKSLQDMITQQQNLYAQWKAAQAGLNLMQQTIATAHGWVPTTMYQINITDATALSFNPPIVTPPPPPPTPVWTTVADEGQVVTIKAGTTIRFGAPAGEQFGADQHSGEPLGSDVWSDTFVVAADETITLNADNLHIADPIPGYVKHLQMLGTVGGVAIVPPAQ